MQSIFFIRIFINKTHRNYTITLIQIQEQVIAICSIECKFYTASDKLFIQHQKNNVI